MVGKRDKAGRTEEEASGGNSVWASEVTRSIRLESSGKRWERS